MGRLIELGEDEVHKALGILCRCALARTGEYRSHGSYVVKFTTMRCRRSADCL